MLAQGLQVGAQCLHLCMYAPVRVRVYADSLNRDGVSIRVYVDARIRGNVYAHIRVYMRICTYIWGSGSHGRSRSGRGRGGVDAGPAQGSTQANRCSAAPCLALHDTWTCG